MKTYYLCVTRCLFLIGVLEAQIDSGSQFCDLTLDELNVSDFKSTAILNGEKNRSDLPLVNLAKPTQLGFIPGESRYVFLNEIYLGTIKKWDLQTNEMTTLMDLDLNTTGERGLTGFVFHPKFEINRWVYVIYNTDNNSMSLSRFDYDLINDTLLNEKKLITYIYKTTRHHYGNGQLTIDESGVLYVGIGADADFYGDPQFGTDINKNGEASASNSNSIAGSILRIIPDSSSKGYRIPPGNFAEYYEEYFRSSGSVNLADEYLAKVKPEIFAKGIRTNFTSTVHPTKGYLAWGEVNTGSNWDEYNIINKPMYSGYPYFHGDNEVTLAGSNPNKNHDPANPVPNNSQFNTGVGILPPVQVPILPPLSTRGPTSATAGAMYDFNMHSGPTRFPKAFDNHLLMFDFENTQRHLFVSSITEEAGEIKASAQKDVSNMLVNVFFRHTIDAAFSPEGELFLLNSGDRTYGTCDNQCGSIDKVFYTGPQCPQVVNTFSDENKYKVKKFQGHLYFDTPVPLLVTFFAASGKKMKAILVNSGERINVKETLFGNQYRGPQPQLVILKVDSGDKHHFDKFILAP